MVPFHVQVLKLLELIGLKQYQDSFKRQAIDGDILSELDEDILERDLNVTTKLHRLRLLKIISGRQSAKNILEGEDPYVVLRPHAS